MEMRQVTEAAFREILDTFSGADGGASFMSIRRLIEDMDGRAAQGDKAAAGVVLGMKQFAKLIQIAKREYP